LRRSEKIPTLKKEKKISDDSANIPKKGEEKRPPRFFL